MVKYEPRTTIKGKVLVDFITEFIPGPLTQCKLLDGWVLKMDRVSNSKVYWIKIIFTTLDP